MTGYVEPEENETPGVFGYEDASQDDHFLINPYPQDANLHDQFDGDKLTDEEIDSEAQFLAKLHKYAAENGHLYSSDDQSVDMSHHFFDRVRRRKQRICGEMILKILNQRCGGCFRPADSKVVKVDRKRASKRPSITEICCHQANCTDEILQEFCCGGQS
ncbi:unnamed protein product [Auanema sp. JU1783]|nr:unnamed protein product [Auanema sp. JU1783]